MQSKRFEKEHRIRFSECDPAGIVFYPQYFVMFNDLMEAWIDTMLPEGFAGMILERKSGLPSVRIEADFRAISRMGDDVILSIAVERIGSRSITLNLRCVGKDERDLRMQVRQVVVTTSLEHHGAVEIPDYLREGMAPYVIDDEARELKK